MEPSATPLPPDEQPNQPAPPELSEREVEVLRLVATGAGNKEIAQKLFISPNTVKVHLRNIFTKIGAASRTEAAMYAARQGLVSLPASAALGVDGIVAPALEAPATAQDGAAFPPSQADRGRQSMRWAAIAILVIAVFGALVLWTLRSRPTPTPAPTAAAAAPRWQHLADMPTARAGLAAVAYDDQIYAIGGESAQGVTGATQRFNPPTNRWEALASKPVPVSNVSAAVVGGRIYIPGGQLASGQMTSTVEVYSPRDNRWARLAPVPAAISGYALAAFEGQLYVFGGWDGEKYLATVYRYQPDADRWTALTPMPTARANAGAAVAGARIYVIGGTGNTGPVAVNEAYIPEQEGPGGAPWQARAPLPQARSRLQAADIADNIYVIGSADNAGLSTFGYLPSTNMWQTFEAPPDAAWTGATMVALDSSLHLLGGKDSATPLARHQVYQALFTVFIPIVR